MPPPGPPAYARIAADLHRRILDGSLPPGHRLPSTRRLAKTWKVALATASKALGTLAQGGAIFAMPRVGYVVAGPPAREPPKAPREVSLEQTTIVRAAIEIADREGLAALSMRGVAAKMGVPVTSLYRHVAKKEDLLRLMVDRAMEDEAEPRPTSGPWRARVEAGARLEWQLVRRHPWVARVMTLTRPIPSKTSLAHAEHMFAALEESGADPTTRMQMHVTLYAFVQGLASNVDSEAQALGETGVDEAEWMHAREPEFVAIADADGFPAFARLLRGMPDGFELDLDRVFELGLALLLNGLVEHVARPKGRKAAPVSHPRPENGERRAAPASRARTPPSARPPGTLRPATTSAASPTPAGRSSSSATGGGVICGWRARSVIERRATAKAGARTRTSEVKPRRRNVAPCAA